MSKQKKRLKSCHDQSNPQAIQNRATKGGVLKPYYDHAGITIYHGDCREILPTLPKVDLVLTDPPYGIDFKQRTTGLKITGDDCEFDPNFLWDTANKFFIWGANHFHHSLPRKGQFHVWLKRAVEIAAPKSYSDCEFGWFSESTSSKVFRLISDGCIREGEGHGIVRLHPSQKPIELLRWCIAMCDEPQSILDPFMGSGTTLRAAKDLGRKAIGIEIEEKYCEIAAKRLSQEVFNFNDVKP